MYSKIFRKKTEHILPSSLLQKSWLVTKFVKIVLQLFSCLHLRTGHVKSVDTRWNETDGINS